MLTMSRWWGHGLCKAFQETCTKPAAQVDQLLFVAGGRPSFYSHENAPGIIMAVGNTGAYLDIEADQLCTWLSRDGGLSWEDVRETAHIYEFGDHGGILVSAKHGTQVRPGFQADLGPQCLKLSGRGLRGQLSGVSELLKNNTAAAAAIGLFLCSRVTFSAPTGSLLCCQYTCFLSTVLVINALRGSPHAMLMLQLRGLPA